MAGSIIAIARRRIRLLATAIVLAAVLVPAEAVPPIIGPSWTELSSQHKQILAPLAGEWDRFDVARRTKWLNIAERYPSLSAEEQTRIQDRMKAWAKLTPEQRHAARTKYKNVRKASPEQREALKKMWDEYASLPDDQKQKYLESAASKSPAKPPKPAVTTKKRAPAILPDAAAAKRAPSAPATPTTPTAVAAPATASPLAPQQ